MRGSPSTSVRTLAPRRTCSRRRWSSARRSMRRPRLRPRNSAWPMCCTSMTHSTTPEGPSRSVRPSSTRRDSMARGWRGGGWGMEARWMVAECCMRLGDLDGFLRIAEEYRDPRLSAGVAARPLHAKLVEGLARLVNGDLAGCEAAFVEAQGLLDTQILASEAMLSSFVHFFYGMALRVAGRTQEGEEQLRKTATALEASGLKGQLTLSNPP